MKIDKIIDVKELDEEVRREQEDRENKLSQKERQDKEEEAEKFRERMNKILSNPSINSLTEKISRNIPQQSGKVMEFTKVPSENFIKKDKDE